MSNMSYCRYQNTSKDLQDCIDNLDQPEDLEEAFNKLSTEERRAADEMREQCETYIRLYDEAIGEVENEEEATFKEGDIVTLHTMGMEYELADAFETTEEEIIEIFKHKAKVISLATYTELGDKDGEYYNLEVIGLMGEYNLDALSGYHLELDEE